MTKAVAGKTWGLTAYSGRRYSDNVAPAVFDYYIGPSGSDSNDGLTTGTPWAITAINSKRSTYSPSGVGKTIGLMDGTYNISSLMTTSRDAPALDIEGGTAGNPVVIKAVNARQAIITAGGATPYNIVNAMIGNSINRTQKGYLTIDGLYVTGGRTNIIELYTLQGQSSSYSTIPGYVVQNCEITGNSDLNSNPGGSNTPGSGGGNAAGITLNNTLNATVTNNYIHDNVGKTTGSSDHLSGIILWACKGTTITYNTCISTGYSIHAKENGTQGSIVAYNYCDIGSQTADQGQIYGFDGANDGTITDTSYIHNNIIISYSGVNLRSEVDAGGWITSCEFYNNTIVGPITSAGFSLFSSAGKLKFYNNLCYNNGSSATNYGWVCTNPNSASVIDYNLYGNARFTTIPNGQYTTASPTTITSFATWQSATGEGAHSSVAAPTFTNAGARALQYTTTTGNAYQTGKTGGTSGGSTVNIGAWDGIVTQIGCNF